MAAMFETRRHALACALATLLLLGGAGACATDHDRYEALLRRADARAPTRALAEADAPAPAHHGAAFDGASGGASGPMPSPGVDALSASHGDAGSGAAGSPLASGTALSLTDLRDAVLDANPGLAAMHEAWRAAIERHPQAAALADPELSYAIAPGTFGADDLDFGQMVQLSQRLPWPGKLRLRGDATLREAEAMEQDFEAARLRLLALTDQLYFEYYLAERAIEINRINQTLLSDLKRIAEARYGAGLVQMQDALLAEVESHHAHHRGIVLDRMRSVTAARINNLMNLPPDAPIPPSPTALEAPAALPDRTVLEAYALAHRPELEAWSLRVRASESEASLARRAYYPDLTLMGSYDTRMERSERRGLVGVGIEVPLQLGARRAAVSEAEAKRRRARSQLVQERAAIQLEVSTLIDEIDESAYVVRLYDGQLLPAARESLDAARSGYEAGTNDFLTLVNAEKTLTLSELSYEEALSEYHQRMAALERAIGGPVADVTAGQEDAR